MSTAAREIRIAVMMLAEVSWEDATGKLQSASARLEDKSLEWRMYTDEEASRSGGKAESVGPLRGVFRSGQILP